MSAVDICPPGTIPGLHYPPSEEDLIMSHAIYNSLLHPQDQPDVSVEILRQLGDIFVRHGAQTVFGIHLLHGHFLAPDGTALVGIPVRLSETSQQACWTKAVPMKELVTMPLYGHVFRLQLDGSFCPYEFHVGRPGFEENMPDPAFFKELADFLRSNRLSDLLALQFLDHHTGKTNIEFEAGPEGTVMLCEEDLLTVSQSRTITGWYFEVGDDGIISCKGGDVYAPQKNNTHKVFQDSKPLPTLESLKKALQEEGIIA